MVTRRGTLLEKNVEKIFKLFGFVTKRNVYINGYEVDVYAQGYGLDIAIQCKQYESASLNVRDLLHEWDSKNKFIAADRIVVSIYGQEVIPENRIVADRLGIILWDEKDLDRVELLSKEDFMKEIHLSPKPLNVKIIKQKKNPLIFLWISVFIFLISLIAPSLMFISIPALIICFMWWALSKRSKT